LTRSSAICSSPWCSSTSKTFDVGGKVERRRPSGRDLLLDVVAVDVDLVRDRGADPEADVVARVDRDLGHAADRFAGLVEDDRRHRRLRRHLVLRLDAGRRTRRLGGSRGGAVSAVVPAVVLEDDEQDDCDGDDGDSQQDPECRVHGSSFRERAAAGAGRP
jgi:hypothetical protein